VMKVAEKFGVTRQAAQLHLRSLTREGKVGGEGTARWRRYQLRALWRKEERHTIGPAFSEDVVWERFVRNHMEDVNEEAREIVQYGVTEMVNNVIDHSGAKKVRVTVERFAMAYTISVSDDGVGMFQKISSALQLSDPHEALLDLSKGKFTTDPKRHTGEGIFFTSRAFDRFSIQSSSIVFTRSTLTDDWRATEATKMHRGTTVTMSLLLPPQRRLVDVFTRFSSGPEDYRFAKTRIPLKLASLSDESLVSRSSAKRVLARIETFEEVLMDFAGIKSIGQAFADEIFRVFALAHPTVELIPVNANEQVTSMIRRAQAAASE
jgi:anti-sigma regulatory factor (Ser/Thr protein kinase)